MKRVLVLFLVLGLASAANAIPWTMSPTDITGTFIGTTFTITGNVAHDLYFGIYDDSSVSTTQQWVAGDIKPAAGGLGSMANNGYAGLDFATLPDSLSSPQKLVTAGPWFTFTYTGNGGRVDTPVGRNYVFNLYDYSVSATQPIGTVVFTPEPATLVILGLGSLMLARRKA
jgi:hypothetical protein